MDNLDTCDIALQEIFQFALPLMDHSILEGHRSKSVHKRYVEQGLSKVSYYRSKHSAEPSRAVHAVPYPVLWPHEADGEKEYRYRLNRFFYFAGIVMGIASRLGIKLRWGGNWNGGDLDRENWDDLAHFELI